MKYGDKIVCIKECRMFGDWKDQRTTIGKTYIILRGSRGYEKDNEKDNRCIRDDKGHEHYFDNVWNQYFRPDRKEKLLKINRISNESTL